MNSPRQLREDALAIFHAGLEAVDPAAAVKRSVAVGGDTLGVAGKTYSLSNYRNIFAIGAGKATAPMALALEEILGPRLAGGVINVKYGHGLPLNTIKINEAGHPIPDEAGVQGTGEIVRLARQAGPADLVFCLFSGGGSALLVAPATGLSLAEKQQTTQVLLACGATIHEINAVRKHLSGVKGGRLAKIAGQASLVSLLISDVIGDDLTSIGSGPTAPDPTTFADCVRIFKKYQIEEKLPAPVRQVIERGMRGEVEETPKPGDPLFARVENVIVANNALALEAASRRAETLGYHPRILSSSIAGETRDAAEAHVAAARETLASGDRRPACLLSGGETTVTLTGRGKGGRNQEFALAAAAAMNGLDSVLIFSAGTDGTDGPTDAAGAVADGTTAARARAKGMTPEAYLAANDSYHFFQALGDLVVTGPTRTNVMDLRIVLLSGAR